MSVRAEGPPRIGVSACFFHADPERPVFKGKTLLYLEESMARYVMGAGGLPVMLPRSAGVFSVADLVAGIDGLVLQGGSDVAPASYGQSPLRSEWSGDAPRDAYEIALIQACLASDTPILGICRGLQIINVALGGTLLQDIATQVPQAQTHRDWHRYDELRHGVRLERGPVRALFGDASEGVINSVHHQAVSDLGSALTVDARSEDGTIEALHLRDRGAYCLGVQWHPEFQTPDDGLLPAASVIADFMAAVARRR